MNLLFSRKRSRSSSKSVTSSLSATITRSLTCGRNRWGEVLDQADGGRDLKHLIKVIKLSDDVIWAATPWLTNKPGGGVATRSTECKILGVTIAAINTSSA
jgi:hypothetical protein